MPRGDEGRKSASREVQIMLTCLRRVLF